MLNSSEKQSHQITKLLKQSVDDSAAREELFNLIYDDLRAAAHRALQKGFRGDLQTTALVNESMLRFQDSEVMRKYSENRRVFFSVAIRAMQQVLLNHFRKRKREVSLNADVDHPFTQVISRIEATFQVDFESLYEALEELRGANTRQHAAITHRFLGGLSVSETAELLGVSVGTIERDCRLAKAKLLRLLSP